MAIVYDKQKLYYLLENFYRLTKIRIAVFDEYQNVLLEYPKALCRLCEKNRKDESFLCRCRESDAAAFRLAAQTESAYIYTCHYGLTEAVKAIRSDEKLIGYLMFGQTASKANIAAILQKAEAGAQDIAVYEQSQLIAGANFMAVCAGYILHNQSMKYVYSGKSKMIKSFLAQNLQQDLSVEKLKARFQLSHTALNKIFKKEEGCGVMQYFVRLRLEKAGELLLSTALPIAEIARLTGFSDVNYFSRAFKNHYAMPPSQYRFR